MMDARALAADFAVSPQLTLEDFAAAAAAGFKAVVNNRPDGEAPGQPPHEAAQAAAAAAGLAYTWIPFAGALGAAQITALGEFLQSAPGPVLAYCRSGTRSAALWAHVQAAQGKPIPELLEAMAAGGYDLAALTPSLRAIAPA
jgi:sulfide:quinone oxidoreductase